MARFAYSLPQATQRVILQDHSPLPLLLYPNTKQSKHLSGWRVSGTAIVSGRIRHGRTCGLPSQPCAGTRSGRVRPDGVERDKEEMGRQLSLVSRRFPHFNISTIVEVLKCPDAAYLWRNGETTGVSHFCNCKSVKVGSDDSFSLP